MAKKAKPAAAKKIAKKATALIKSAPVKATKPAKEAPKAAVVAKPTKEVAKPAKEAKGPKASPARASKGEALDSAAAATAAAGPVASSPPKNFRNHPDIENFYRFIYENDLREEGLEILNAVMLKKAEKRAAKKAGLTLEDDDAILGDQLAHSPAL